MPTLRRYTPALALLCLTLRPEAALAWESPSGSPPEWRPHWVQTVESTTAFVNASGELSFGEVAAGMFFRVDAPEQLGRIWVYDPVGEAWAWLARRSTTTVDEPTVEQVQASAPPLDPRAYLYVQAPEIAPRLDCIIAGESNWDPSVRNPRSGAAGLAQFLPSTWVATPEGQLGLSPYEPLASIDAAIWLARTRGWTQWQVYTQGRCH